MKKSLEGLKIRVEQAEGRISKLDLSIVTIQCEEQRKKNKGKGTEPQTPVSHTVTVLPCPENKT